MHDLSSVIYTFPERKEQKEQSYNLKKNKSYGWSIASYGEKYSYNKNQKAFDYKKNHSGFNEPIFSFVPSILRSMVDLTKTLRDLLVEKRFWPT